jgi:hypothetical protein
MCVFCDGPCWRDGADGGRECAYSDEEWQLLADAELEELERQGKIVLAPKAPQREDADNA